MKISQLNVSEYGIDIKELPFPYLYKLETKWGECWLVPHNNFKSESENIPTITLEEIKELEKIIDLEFREKIIEIKFQLKSKIIKHKTL